MQRFTVGFVAMLTAMLAAVWLVTRPAPRPAVEAVPPSPTQPVPTHLDPHGVPDFAAYPQADGERYTLSRNSGFPIDGFRTATGFACMTVGHRAMYALDCNGPFVNAPDGANHVHLFSYGANTGAVPMRFGHADEPIDSYFYGVHADDASVLPAGELFDVGNAKCIYTDEILLACRMGTPVQGNGFIATATSTTTFGRT